MTDIMSEVFSLKTDYFDLSYVEALSETLDDLDALLIECEIFEEGSLFLEDVSGQGKAGGTLRQAMDRGGELRRGTAEAYGATTDAGGNVLYHSVNLGTKIMVLLSKVLAFILNLISKIPEFLTKIVDFITKWTKRGYMKLTGKIGMYITYEDLNYFQKNIKQNIEDYIKAASTFGQDTKQWNMKSNINVIGKIASGQGSSDLNSYKNMKSRYLMLKTVKFKETILDFKDPRIQQTYFSSDSAYFNLINEIMGWLGEYKEQMKQIEETMKDRIRDSQFEGNYNELQLSQKTKIQLAVKWTAGVYKLIAEFMKYVMQDLKTIEKRMVPDLPKNEEEQAWFDEISRIHAEIKETEAAGRKFKDKKMLARYEELKKIGEEKKYKFPE